MESGVSMMSAWHRHWVFGPAALAALLCLGSTAPSRAAPAAARVRESVLGPASAFTRRAWTTDEGLPDNSILAIAQTRDGYLWIGTRGGLARFDGVRFVVFDQRTQPDWSSDVVDALHPSRDGGLWVGTVDGGLLRLRNGVFSQVPPADIHSAGHSRGM